MTWELQWNTKGPFTLVILSIKGIKSNNSRFCVNFAIVTKSAIIRHDRNNAKPQAGQILKSEQQ